MKLLIKPMNDMVKGLYENHGHFHEGDMGLDLFIPEQIVCLPKTTTKIGLQIKCEPLSHPGSSCGYFLLPRSSIIKTPLRLANSIGVIDKSYRGEIIAVVDNISDSEYILEAGSRMFQLISHDGTCISFTIVNEISETTRREGGFGSTNKQ